jgi:hypothetical protein
MLGTTLPQEMTRVRDEVMPAYQKIGKSGALAVFMMKRDLDIAAKAMMEGDIVTMIKVYQSLKAWEL